MYGAIAIDGMCAAKAAQGAMHVATTRRHYIAKGRHRREYEAHLLRRSYRDGQ